MSDDVTTGITPTRPEELRHPAGHTAVRPGMCVNLDRVGNLALVWTGYDGSYHAIDEIPAVVVDLIVKAHGDLARGDGPRYDNGTVEAVSRG